MSNMTRSTGLNFEKVQSNINSFKERFAVLEEETADLTHKIQSMTVGAETLFERIQTTKCINGTLSKGYDRLIGRMSIQEGTIHAISIMSKDEILSLTNKLHTLESSVKALEHNSGQKIWGLQKAMVNRLEKIEEILNSDEQEQTVERQILTPSVSKTLRDNSHKTLPAFSVITREGDWFQKP